MARPFSGDSRRRHLRRLRRRDVVTTREGWIVDLAGPVRIEAVRALADDAAPPVEAALIDMLADPLDEVRAEAVRALRAQASSAGAERCATVAPGWDPRRYAASREQAWALLTELAAPGIAVPLASSLLMSEHSPTVDARAQRALDDATADDEALRQALERALRCLEHDDPGVVARAREITFALGRRSPDTVAAALADDPCAPAAVAALGEIGDLRFIPDVAALLSPSRPPSVRAAAATALGKLGGHGAARLLVSTVDDPDPRVRRAVTEALAPLAGLVAMGDPPQDSTPPSPEATAAPVPEAPRAVDDWMAEETAPDAVDAHEAPASAEARAEGESPVTPSENDGPRGRRQNLYAAPRPAVLQTQRHGAVALASHPETAVAHAPELVEQVAEPELVEPEPEALVELEPEAPVEAEAEALVEPEPEAHVEPVPEASVEPDPEMPPLDADPDAPWNRPHGPAVSAPPPRPRGARRPTKRR